MSADHVPPVETSQEKPKKKKRRKVILWAALALILVPLLAIGAYLFMLNRAWSQAGTIENALPAENGTVSNLSQEQAQKLKDLVATETQPAFDPKITESNKTDADADGNGVVDALETGQVTDRPAETGSTDILLLGSDSRAGSAEAATVSGQRADTLMILHIPADGQGSYLISIMRDTWTNIPGYGMAKVNAGLNYGGVSLQVATIEQLTGIRINHVAEVDFQGFKGLVDSIGGVTVDVPLSFNATPAGYSFTQGPQHMTGGDALVFVRERYVFSDGDYQRVRNQRAFLRGFVDTVKNKGALENIGNFQGMVSEIAPYLTLSDGLGVTTIATLAAPFITSGNTSVHMMTLPNAGVGWSADGQSIVVNSTQATSDLAAAYQAEDMGSFFAKYGQD